MEETNSSSSYFHRDFRVFFDPFHRHDIRLEITGDSDEPVKGLRHGQGVTYGQTGVFRADVPVLAASDDRENGRKNCHQVTDQLDSDCQPSEVEQKKGSIRGNVDEATSRLLKLLNVKHVRDCSNIGESTGVIFID